MTVGVYGIFDYRDDTCLYVGQSKNIEYRLKKHIVSLRSQRHDRPGFNHWFSDNGEQNIETRILEICENTPSAKNALEQKWFDELNPLFWGKNPSSRGVYGSGERRGIGITTSQLLNQGITFDDAERLYVANDFSALALAKIWNCSANSVYILLKHLNVTLGAERKKFKKDPIKCAFCPKVFIPGHKRIKTCSRSCGALFSHPKTSIPVHNTSYDYVEGSQEQRAAKVAAHNRWHKSRGIISDTCEICLKLSQTDESLVN